MTILFCGGELDDFSYTSGAVTFNTAGGPYRSTYARGAIDIPGAAANFTNYATASFTASSAFSCTCRVYVSGTTWVTGCVFLAFSIGGVRRLRLRTTGSAPSTIVLETNNGTTSTTLATSSATITHSTLYRLDVIVDYQTSGRVRVFVDGTSIIDYSGDVTTSGTTTLDAVWLGMFYTVSSTSGRFSEVIVCTQDSRTLSLKTMVPDAAGTTSSWTGAYTDIDETTASDVDVMTSATANQVTSVNTTGMPSGWSNLTVTAVKCTASAARGSTGPSKLALGVRTNSSDSFPTAVTLDTGFSTATTTYYELNPVTGIAWTTAEVDALQLAFRSET